MPSPTSRTRPTSAVSILSRYPVICSVSTETISFGLNLMTTSREELVANIVNACADGGVQLLVANSNLQSSQQRRIHVWHENRIELKTPLDPFRDASTLVARERDGRIYVNL